MSNRTTSATDFAQRRKRLFDSPALAHHIDTGLRIQQPRQPLAEQRVVVHEQNPNRFLHRSLECRAFLLRSCASVRPKTPGGTP
jgi:hypothetical protein